jgi:hypothetical protein
MMSARILMAITVSVSVFYGLSFGELWSRTSPNVRLTTSSDKVGIGTSTIGSKLQVNGNAAVGYSASTAAPSNGLAVSGNTGIGTTTVGSKLQVNGNAAVGYSASTAAPTNGLLVNGHVGIGTTDATYNKLVVVSDATSMNTLSVANWNSMTAILAQSNGSQATMSVSNQNGTNGVAADFYGNVQISSGSLKINNWSIEAPDYVFEKDYKLPSLTSVEKHIAANKHLPGVPSAADMKKNGVDLSEMNMTLLKKVEELTLYVIDQNKQILEQNKKIETLERKVSEK